MRTFGNIPKSESDVREVMGYKQMETDNISEEKFWWLYTVVCGFQLKKLLFLAIIRASTQYQSNLFLQEYLNTPNSGIYIKSFLCTKLSLK